MHDDYNQIMANMTMVITMEMIAMIAMVAKIDDNFNGIADDHGAPLVLSHFILHPR